MASTVVTVASASMEPPTRSDNDSRVNSSTTWRISITRPVAVTHRPVGDLGRSLAHQHHVDGSGHGSAWSAEGAGPRVRSAGTGRGPGAAHPDPGRRGPGRSSRGSPTTSDRRGLDSQAPSDLFWRPPFLHPLAHLCGEPRARELGHLRPSGPSSSLFVGTPGPVVTSPAVARYLSAHGGRRPTKTSRGPRRSFSKQFKAEIVDLVRQPGNTPASVARNLDLSRGPRRSCSKRVQGGPGCGRPGCCGHRPGHRHPRPPPRAAGRGSVRGDIDPRLILPPIAPTVTRWRGSVSPARSGPFHPGRPRPPPATTPAARRPLSP